MPRRLDVMDLAGWWAGLTASERGRLLHRVGAGQEDLHHRTADIARLKATCDALAREAGERGLSWRR